MVTLSSPHMQQKLGCIHIYTYIYMPLLHVRAALSVTKAYTIRVAADLIYIYIYATQPLLHVRAALSVTKAYY